MCPTETDQGVRRRPPAGWADSHLHFDEFVAAGEQAAVIERAGQAGVHRLLAIGGRPSANDIVVRLAAEFPGRVFGAAGYDRDLAEAPPPLDALRRLLDAPGVVAVGETGLDYHYAPETASGQRALFEAQLELAREKALPVVIHSRDADDDTARLVMEHAARWPGDPGRIGVLHCFTGTAAFAGRLLETGLHISFSGIITFKNADALREVARQVPLDRLLIETDAPFLAPAPYRGKRNEPAYVVEVARTLAKIRNDSFEHIADSTSHNAARLFGWT
jgi:TatD DNase family protein